MSTLFSFLTALHLPRLPLFDVDVDLTYGVSSGFDLFFLVAFYCTAMATSCSVLACFRFALCPAEIRNASITTDTVIDGSFDMPALSSWPAFMVWQLFPPI